MAKHNNIVAIIPARGGSKSIPRKNIKLLGGKPLIAYPIELAKSIKQINRVIVSTEDEEIAKVAREYGAEVPFIRPMELAQDDTATLPVLQHCIDYLEKNEGYKPDLILLLYTTSPFLKKETAEKAIELMQQNDYGTVLGVIKDYGRFWAFDKDLQKHVPFYPQERINRQNYKPLYRETGSVYFSTRDTLMVKQVVCDDKNIGFVEMSEEEVVDIDHPEDWAKAERMLALAEKNKK